MTQRDGRYYLDVLSGRRRGALPTALRLAAAAVEPGYRAMVTARNLLYDRGLLPSHSLPRRAISVGNLTTGGTGKTPLVIWLGAALRDAGHKPAVLLRGYKSRDGLSDEAVLIAEAARVPVVCDPDRRRGALRAVADHPEIDTLILDDALQHRRVKRDLEIVVISALDPWGGGHVLPRGLLREPISGLRRAGALVITHSSEAGPGRIEAIIATIRRYNLRAPVFQSDHRLTGLAPDIPLSALAGKTIWAACAIGQPEAFLTSLHRHGATLAGQTLFPDHHAYTRYDLTELETRAAAAGATAIVVTEKDWTKLSRLSAPAIPIWPAKLALNFSGNGASRLLELACGTP